MTRPVRAKVLASALAALGLAALAPPSLAQPVHVGFSDARIHTLPYDPDRITSLNAYFGYQMMIRFGDDERIENVAIGDGATWQITPNKAASLLFVKPLDHASHTNMTVITDRRSYLFELTASDRPARASDMTYVVRFTYPPEPVAPKAAKPPPPAPPERRNAAYTYTGSKALLPSVVFDDGHVTYFKWPEATTTPALFLLAADGSESLVNSSFRDGYQVVEQTAPRFRLRDGKEVTTIINDGWRDPSPGDSAPQPHDAKTAREAEHDASGR
jgi:type IV secretion system protein VirB9